LWTKILFFTEKSKYLHEKDYFAFEYHIKSKDAKLYDNFASLCYIDFLISLHHLLAIYDVETRREFIE
jgi:hypothetical protein